MTFRYPSLLAVAIVAGAALAFGYHVLQQRRTRALAAAGLRPARRDARRHVPPILFLVAITLLLAALSRPQATIKLPHTSGTVVITIDVSNSMTANDAPPTRLAAAQSAAVGLIRAQPDSVEVGVVAFDQSALTTHRPSDDHDQAIAAVNSLRPAGGTSLGQAILAALGTIVGHSVKLPASGATAPPDLGYWGSATIVVFSDGEDTGGPDALAAAALAADAGVHIDTVGIGTTTGTTITVDGYQVATALDQDLLTQIATTTTGTYHPATDSAALDSVYRTLDQRLTSRAESVELTGAVALAAVILLMIGGMLMTTWYGRIV